MADLVRICAVSELPAEGEVCEMAGGRLCVGRLNNEISVLDNECPHSGGPLGQGMIEDGRVVCPFHGWAFDLKDGTASHNPSACVRVYEAVVKDGALFVRSSDSVG